MSDVPRNRTPPCLQLGAQLGGVVQLAVVGDARARRDHRLRPGRREVEDREPAVPEVYLAVAGGVRVGPVAVRAAVGDGRGHPVGDAPAVGPAVGPCDAAHVDWVLLRSAAGESVVDTDVGGRLVAPGEDVLDPAAALVTHLLAPDLVVEQLQHGVAVLVDLVGRGVDRGVLRPTPSSPPGRTRRPAARRPCTPSSCSSWRRR